MDAPAEDLDAFMARTLAAATVPSPDGIDPGLLEERYNIAPLQPDISNIVNISVSNLSRCDVKLGVGRHHFQRAALNNYLLEKWTCMGYRTIRWTQLRLSLRRTAVDGQARR
jgi:hypothetical protein